jgi:inorganic pyrophosphatase
LRFVITMIYMAENIITYKALIEIPAGSNVKYEFNNKSGKLEVDHINPKSVKFPENYGFLIGKKGKDGDDFDAMVLTSQPIMGPVQIEVRIIGVIEMEDEHGEDDKFLCVPLTDQNDPETGSWQNVDDIPKDRLEKIVNFYKTCKDWEKDGWTKVRGILNKVDAYKKLNNN